MVVAAAAQDGGAPAAGVVERFLRETGLADARLALDETRWGKPPSARSTRARSQANSARRPISALAIGRAYK